MIKYTDLITDPDCNKTYFAGAGITCELTPKNALAYKNAADVLHSTNNSSTDAGIDIAFIDEDLSRHNYFNFYFKCNFPQFNTVSNTNIPNFEFYLNTETTDDYIVRFTPSFMRSGYAGKQYDLYSTAENFSTTAVEADSLASKFIFDTVDTDGWVGFSFSKTNVNSILDDYYMELAETFGYPIKTVEVEYTGATNTVYEVPTSAISIVATIVGAGGGSGGGYGMEVWGGPGYSGEVYENVTIDFEKSINLTSEGIRQLPIIVGSGGSGGAGGGLLTDTAAYGGSGGYSKVGNNVAKGGSGGRYIGCFPPMQLEKPDCAYATGGYTVNDITYGKGADGTTDVGVKGSSGYVKLTVQYYDMTHPTWDDIKRFGIKFYINNLLSTGSNFEESHTFQIKDIEFAKTIEESKSPSLYIRSSGSGYVYCNGRKLNI